jgi:hypothetical protein
LSQVSIRFDFNKQLFVLKTYGGTSRFKTRYILKVFLRSINDRLSENLLLDDKNRVKIADFGAFLIAFTNNHLFRPFKHYDRRRFSSNLLW